MEYNKNTTCGVGYSVSTPIFPESERMTRFYDRAHEVIEANFVRIRTERGGGMLTADFAICEEDGVTRITLRQRMRVCGQLSGEKCVTHMWRDGAIVTQRRRGNVRIGRKRREERGKKQPQ